MIPSSIEKWNARENKSLRPVKKREKFSDS